MPARSIPNSPCDGFTLIELIAVMVVLGIVAVAAAAQFADLRQSSRVAVIDQMTAALVSGGEASSLICLANADCDTGVGAIWRGPAFGRTCQFVNGFVDAGQDSGGLYCEIEAFVNSQGFTLYFDPGTGYTDFRLTSAPHPPTCYARYHQVLPSAPTGTRPQISSVTTGC